MAADPLTKSTVDGLFNDDFSDFDDDPFADKPTIKDSRDDKAVLSPRAGAKRKAGDDDKENDGLGLDEEVKITKKRKPIAKLDEARLLSEPGIPKLRTITRSRQLTKKLRIKGKGHEFSDAARLLNHFQLWLDNLYPRAKFADALQLVEKAGHTKRMHVMRTEWINEGKPGYGSYDDTLDADKQHAEPDLFDTTQAYDPVSTTISDERHDAAQQSNSVFGNGFDDDALFIPDANRPSPIDRDDEPDDDELDALLATHDSIRGAPMIPRQDHIQNESEGEDDLDALLAEQDAQRARPSRSTGLAPGGRHLYEGEDDLDTPLAELSAGDARAGTRESEQPTTDVNSDADAREGDEIDDDEDDLETLLAMQPTTSRSAPDEPEPSLPTPQPTSSPEKGTGPPHTIQSITTQGLHSTMFSSSPVPNNPEDLDLDDLEALLASQEAKTNGQTDDYEQRTPRVNKVRAAADALLSSSPIPNEDSQ